MFAVIFEVHPRANKRDAYLGIAKMLHPEVEQIDGFVDNIRYRSLTRDGWLLSLSSWRDEQAIVRWRTHVRHHEAQEKGRTEIFAEYRLRVGEVARDGTLTLIEGMGPGEPPAAPGLVAWDLCDAILTPGNTILLMSWRTSDDAQAFERATLLPEGARLRHVRVGRDYGMFDRREAPQSFPEIRPPTKGI